MLTILIMSRGTSEELESKLISSYRAKITIKSSNGPKDLVNERWDGIYTDLTKGLQEHHYGDGIELVLAGLVRDAEDQTFSPEEHLELIEAESAILGKAKAKAMHMINGYIRGEKDHDGTRKPKIITVLLIADHIENKIQPIKDHSE